MGGTPVFFADFSATMGGGVVPGSDGDYGGGVVPGSDGDYGGVVLFSFFFLGAAGA